MATESAEAGCQTVVVRHATRLDTFVLAVCPGLSRRQVRRLIDAGAVRVDGRRVRRGAHVAPGAQVILPRSRLVPEPDLPVAIVHVDAHVIVVDKPGGMPGHALDPRQRGTVAGFLAARFPETAALGDPLSSGLAHRLDTGTSGLQVAARTPAAHVRLRAAFAAGEIAKRYLAIVVGTAPSSPLTIDTPLAHDPGDRRRMVAAVPGRRAWPAHTELVRLAVGGGHSLVQATLHSGVTHQVRVHLALLGFPVLGDRLYGGPDAGLGPRRHALHASALEPGAGVALLPPLTSPLPDDLQRLAPR